MEDKVRPRIGWTRQQLLVAFNLYCRIPFGKLHYRNPEIVKYAALLGRTPSALAMKLSNIASLDPAITSTGRKGLEGASAADKAMWNEMQSGWERFALQAQQALCDIDASIELEANVSDASASIDAVDYTGRTRSILATIRIGQDFFRRAVLSAYDYRCCITGLDVPQLLVASHIVPWRTDTKNRLNPRNGLCLSMLHDKAFDVGIITIAENMTVRVSLKHIKKAAPFFKSALLAYDGKPISLPEKFHPNEEFLARHRNWFLNRETSDVL
jgi:putative restriction endonuclease